MTWRQMSDPHANLRGRGLASVLRGVVAVSASAGQEGQLEYSPALLHYPRRHRPRPDHSRPSHSERSPVRRGWMPYRAAAPARSARWRRPPFQASKWQLAGPPVGVQVQSTAAPGTRVRERPLVSRPDAVAKRAPRDAAVLVRRRISRRCARCNHAWWDERTNGEYREHEYDYQGDDPERRGPTGHCPARASSGAPVGRTVNYAGAACRSQRHRRRSTGGRNAY